MSIYHTPLRGMVEQDKLIELHCMEDDDGDPQELVFASVRRVMSKQD